MRVATEMTVESAPRLIASIVPEAWIEDCAVEVDAEGETEWDATEAVSRLSAVYAATLEGEIAMSGYAVDTACALMGDQNAPEWVRNWTGPCTIYVNTTQCLTCDCDAGAINSYCAQCEAEEN